MEIPDSARIRLARLSPASIPFVRSLPILRQLAPSNLYSDRQSYLQQTCNLEHTEDSRRRRSSPSCAKGWPEPTLVSHASIISSVHNGETREADENHRSRCTKPSRFGVETNRRTVHLGIRYAKRRVRPQASPDSYHQLVRLSETESIRQLPACSTTCFTPRKRRNLSVSSSS